MTPSNPLLERLNALGGWDDVAAQHGEEAADSLLEVALAWATYPSIRRGAERKFQAILSELGVK